MQRKGLRMSFEWIFVVLGLFVTLYFLFKLPQIKEMPRAQLIHYATWVTVYAIFAAFLYVLQDVLRLLGR